jgi:hypothetical protein
VVLALCLAAPVVLGGCLGSFASNQARRQAARTTDHYIREYADPQTRNDVADTIVRTGNPRQKNRVGVDDKGWLTNEPNY